MAETTRSELVSLLRHAESALWDVVCGDTSTVQRAHQEIALALRRLSIETADGTCADCGNTLVQRGNGRPREYCNDTCKKRAQRKRRAAGSANSEV
jgi:hypothetical protein